MAFNAKVSSNTNTNSGSKVDYDALNKYVVDKVGCTDQETMLGIVSGIIDLGMQELPDAEYELKGEKEVGKTIEELNEEFADLIEQGKITKFAEVYNADKKAKEIRKFVPQKPRHCVDLLVDFPTITLDKGQFFNPDEDSVELPYRMSIGGAFYQKAKGKNLVGRPTVLRLTKDDKIGWTMPLNSTLYKMAIASKIIKKDEAFLPQDIDKLLGKSFYFNVHVYLKSGSGANSDKKYLNETIKYASGVPKGVSTIDDYPTFMIQFEEESYDEQSLKNNIRAVHKNQMKESLDFAGSALEKALGLDVEKEENTEDKSDKVSEQKINKEVQASLDDDLPF